MIKACLFTGKMEMFSRKFGEAVKSVFSRDNVRILATIPVKINSGPLGNLIDSLKANPKSQLITVTPQNRDNLAGEIISILNPDQ